MAYKDKTKEKTHCANYYAVYYESNKETILFKQLIYYEKNKETKLSRQASYRLNHPERIKVIEAARYLRRRERVLQEQRIYRKNHPEVGRKGQKRYRIAHPEKKREHEKKRRAREYNAPINDFTAQQWSTMQELYDHRCVYCQKRFKGKLTQDHITPLSKGGSHTLANIAPACHSCNSKKHAGSVLKPVQPLLLV